MDSVAAKLEVAAGKNGRSSSDRSTAEGPRALIGWLGWSVVGGGVPQALQPQEEPREGEALLFPGGEHVSPIPHQFQSAGPCSHATMALWLSALLVLSALFEHTAQPSLLQRRQKECVGGCLHWWQLPGRCGGWRGLPVRHVGGLASRCVGREEELLSERGAIFEVRPLRDETKPRYRHTAHRPCAKDGVHTRQSVGSLVSETLMRCVSKGCGTTHIPPTQWDTGQTPPTDPAHLSRGATIR